MAARAQQLRLFNLLRDNPLKAVARALNLSRARLAFRGHAIARGVTAAGWVRAEGPGSIRLDAGVTFEGGMITTEVLCHEGAAIRVGEGSAIGYGVSIEAYESISIGQRCLLASYVRVADRAGGRSGPIVIGDDVWLAHAVIVEPGVVIGAGAVIAPGSVVTEDVPAGALAAGNPARWVSEDDSLTSPGEGRP